MNVHHGIVKSLDRRDGSRAVKVLEKFRTAIVDQKLQDMTETTHRMKWVMNVDGVLNGNPRANQAPPAPPDTHSRNSTEELPQSPSPSKSPTRRQRLLKKNTKSGR